MGNCGDITLLIGLIGYKPPFLSHKNALLPSPGMILQIWGWDWMSFAKSEPIDATHQRSLLEGSEV